MYIPRFFQVRHISTIHPLLTLLADMINARDSLPSPMGYRLDALPAHQVKLGQDWLCRNCLHLNQQEVKPAVKSKGKGKAPQGRRVDSEDQEVMQEHQVQNLKKKLHYYAIFGVGEEIMLAVSTLAALDALTAGTSCSHCPPQMPPISTEQEPSPDDGENAAPPDQPTDDMQVDDPLTPLSQILPLPKQSGDMDIDNNGKDVDPDPMDVDEDQNSDIDTDGGGPDANFDDEDITPDEDEEDADPNEKDRDIHTDVTLEELEIDLQDLMANWTCWCQGADLPSLTDQRREAMVLEANVRSFLEVVIDQAEEALALKMRRQLVSRWRNPYCDRCRELGYDTDIITDSEPESEPQQPSPQPSEKDEAERREEEEERRLRAHREAEAKKQEEARAKAKAKEEARAKAKEKARADALHNLTFTCIVIKDDLVSPSWPAFSSLLNHCL